MNIEFSELKQKEVVNILDGRKLGRVIDLVIDCELTKIKGIIVPGEKGFNLFKSCDDLYIPYKNIKRIGDDVVLVEVLFEDKLGCTPNAKTCKLSKSLEDEEET